MTAVRRPVLFVTNHAPPDRAGAFVELDRRVELELALFGGRSHHATAGLEDPGVTHRRVAQRAVHALAASGRYRAVVCGTAGRAALPAAFTGARRAHVPFVLWSALWAQLRTPAHLAARPLMASIYRSADAVVAYGPHVAAFARARGARRVAIAPQAVDNAFWRAGARERAHGAPLAVGFVGRDVPEKGLAVLLEAWAASGLESSGATLRLAGPAAVAGASAAGVEALGALDAPALRNFYAQLDVLVVPSIATRGFREPWALVVNEAMNQRVAIIASDAVGAAAGGLVRDGESGLVVPAGDAAALAAALARLQAQPELRARLGARGASDVAAYTHGAWADAFAGALDELDGGARRRAW